MNVLLSMPPVARCAVVVLFATALSTLACNGRTTGDADQTRTLDAADGGAGPGDGGGGGPGQVTLPEWLIPCTTTECPPSMTCTTYSDVDHRLPGYFCIDGQECDYVRCPEGERCVVRESYPTQTACTAN